MEGHNASRMLARRKCRQVGVSGAGLQFAMRITLSDGEVAVIHIGSSSSLGVSRSRLDLDISRGSRCIIIGLAIMGMLMTSGAPGRIDSVLDLLKELGIGCLFNEFVAPTRANLIRPAPFDPQLVPPTDALGVELETFVRAWGEAAEG